MPDSTVSVAFAEQYSALIYNLAQQKGSKFRNRVRNEPVVGNKNAFFERLGLAEVQEIVSRHGDTPLNEIEHTRRMLTPTDYNTAELLDTQDKIKMLIDPTNPYAVAQSNALGRKMDDIVITAAIGNAATGVTGATPIALYVESTGINGDGTKTEKGTAITNGVEVVITLEKILLMTQLFNDEDVSVDIPKHWAVSPASIKEMLNIDKIGSADYNTVRAIQQGLPQTYAGFMFFFTTRLLTDGDEGTSWRSFAWAEDGLVLGLPEDITARITERADKNYSTQVYAEMSLGAVRIEGNKVHECWNLKS